ncbi:hypothetical protein wcw_0663 [Waddlia chondrophila WSU 86-1044]|uniref:Uncharacterized protein n=2 Tax=Waddlia chondrophila TaxID=71667 RepID=D6YV70_WADCW|nr:hypothetical protein wcw_0663 [Waddlia chondrophila WSU 86-1044]
MSDCCCCLDSAERGQDRTVHNNLRMILEDICCVIHSSEDDKILERLYNGKHQASNSVGFAKNHYSTHEIGQLYGILSKISHHSMQELIVRQWVNRDGLLSHLKPFNPERSQATLNILLLVIHLSRIAGEVVEKICIKELDKPYFWESPQTKRKNPPIDTLIHNLCEKISVLMNQNSDQVTEPTANV